MLPLWRPRHYTTLTRDDLTKSEKKELNYLLKIGNFETFYNILDSSHLKDFLEEFLGKTKKFGLEYKIHNLSLENPYRGCHQIDDLAKFSVEQYNSHSEPIQFVRIVRLFNLDYEDLSLKDYLIRSSYFFTLEAKDQAGALQIYHSNVFTGHSCQNTLTNFRLASSSSGQTRDEEKHRPWVNEIFQDLVRRKRMYKECYPPPGVFEFYEKEAKLSEAFGITRKFGHNGDEYGIFTLYPYDEYGIFTLYPYDDVRKEPDEELQDIAQFVAEVKYLEVIRIVKVNRDYAGDIYYMILESRNEIGRKSTYRAEVFVDIAKRKELIHFDEMPSSSSLASGNPLSVSSILAASRVTVKYSNCPVKSSRQIQEELFMKHRWENSSWKPKSY